MACLFNFTHNYVCGLLPIVNYLFKWMYFRIFFVCVIADILVFVLTLCIQIFFKQKFAIMYMYMSGMHLGGRGGLHPPRRAPAPPPRIQVS